MTKLDVEAPESGAAGAQRLHALARTWGAEGGQQHLMSSLHVADTVR